jgi:hypothetical protein
MRPVRRNEDVCSSSASASVLSSVFPLTDGGYQGFGKLFRGRGEEVYGVLVVWSGDLVNVDIDKRKCRGC